MENEEFVKYTTVQTKEACPVCGKKELNICHRKMDLPYFGEVYEVLVVCDSCGTKNVSLFSVSEKPPVRIEFPVEAKEDMEVRVIKSNSAKISIPELGVDIEPGVASDSAVTNVENVLNRIVDVLEMPSTKDKAQSKIIKEQISSAKKGEYRLTLIIEDASGMSNIESKKAKKTQLL